MAGSMKQAVAIRHVAFEDLGSLEPALVRAGYRTEYLDVPSERVKEAEDADPDLVIVLGGPIGAYEEKTYPFLLDELKLIEQRLREQRPTLGICLGAQLMVRAAGGRVYPGHEKEIGWGPITLSEAGEGSPLGSLKGVSVLHWHGDTFDLPKAAIHLASTDLYRNQAFAIGQEALGVQFHPEIVGERLERWYIGHACEIASTPGVSVEALRHDTRSLAQNLRTRADKLWRRWLAELENPANPAAAKNN